MTLEINLNDIWEHTLSNILKQGPNTGIGKIIRLWIKFHQFDDFISFLQSHFDDFKPSGHFTTYKKSSDAERELTIPTTPLKIIYNFRRYIQHVMQQPYANQQDHPLLQDNWIEQTNKGFMKFVIYHSKNTLKCIPIPNGELKFLKKSLQKYLLTQSVVKTQLHIKTKCKLTK